MSIIIVGGLLCLLAALGSPTLYQIARSLRYLAALSESPAGDMVKTIDLPGSSSTR